MKNLIISIIIFTAGAMLGSIADINALLGLGDNESAGTAEKKPLYWVAPMDKNYRRDGPGLSPMGMDLVPVYEEDVSGENDNSVKISPVVQNNLGVATTIVKRQQLTMPVETVGSVQFDESRIIHIHSRVEGWIEKLNIASSGDPVKQGQTLFELYSPALVSAQEEYLAALRSGNSNLVKASKSRLTSLGLTAEHIARLERRRKVEQRISFVAENDGIVIDLKVRQGMYIKPAMELLSLGTLDSVWVVGEVFERQAYLLAQGQSVDISLNAMPGRSWQGSVNYIYPQLDPVTRTLKIRVRVQNTDHSLRPNMLANLRVQSVASQETLTIPRQALIKAGQHTRVVKALGEGRFKSVLVEAGLEGEVEAEGGNEVEKRIQILSGLSEGDLVVTSAQFLIDSESNIEAELQRMEEARPQTESKPTNRVSTTGKVNSLMPDMGMVNITHAPIPEWDWPTMKMDFQVDDNLDLSALKVGEDIHFELEKTGDWDYLIVGLGEGAASVGANAEMEEEAPEDDAVMTSGKVKSLMLDMGMLEVVHEPIPEWGWPVMSMTFVLASGESLPILKPGDDIVFALRENQDGDYEISNVKLK